LESYPLGLLSSDRPDGIDNDGQARRTSKYLHEAIRQVSTRISWHSGCAEECRTADSCLERTESISERDETIEKKITAAAKAILTDDLRQFTKGLFNRSSTA
jgi:hypothetical protein